MGNFDSALRTVENEIKYLTGKIADQEREELYQKAQLQKAERDLEYAKTTLKEAQRKLESAENGVHTINDKQAQIAKEIARLRTLLTEQNRKQADLKAKMDSEQSQVRR